MTDPLLDVRGLSKVWSSGRAALSDVSFTLDSGRTMAIVGPSGSGKSTLARCLAGYEKPTAGEIRFQGERHQIQLIAQQPASSLNPRFTAAEIIEEPLVIQRRDVAGAAARAMELVALPKDGLRRRAHQFSGGERQRLAIARAMVLAPKLVVLDESLSGLDPELQDQMRVLLIGLAEWTGVAYLIITHDLSLAAAMASSIAVMADGQLVEQAPAGELFERPRHPLTRELIAATRALSV
jgi:ABC-type dipeptide/oligopeptide/nickel transport system ATPase subunit